MTGRWWRAIEIAAVYVMVAVPVTIVLDRSRKTEHLSPR
jgi:hypothetical protein